MSNRPTPETDAETMRDEYDHVDSDIGPFTPSDTVPAEFARKLERERDEARKEFLIANDKMVEAECSVRGIASVMEKVQRERNKTMKQVKEIIYIAERAIALAEIDFENDKFGVVSELRSDLEKIKEETK